MPTPSENKALAFVAIVTLLAGAVRVVRAGGPATPEPTPMEQQGLARQAYAADSASARQRAAKSAKKSAGATNKLRLAPRKRDAGINVVGGVASVPSATGHPDRASRGRWPDDSSTSPLGFPPPGPRIDVGTRWPDTASPVVNSKSGRRLSSAPLRRGGLIDLDSATEEQLLALPRVGPALARRILANRDSLGPFRSLEGLRRVRGIGPATLARLDSLVTFSGQKRP